MSIQLITTFGTSSSERNSEISLAQEMNEHNPLIECIYVLSEADISWFNAGTKTKIIKTQTRPTFSDIVQFANSLPNQTVAISNADIFFDNTLELISLDTNTVLCLSRWIPDYQPDFKPLGPIKNVFAYDTWVLKTPIKNISNIDFTPGKLGCDSRFSYELLSIGKKLINPSEVVRSFHVHSSNIRNYSEANRVYGKYLAIDPSDSFEFNEKSIHHGYYDGVAVVFPHTYSWLGDLEDVEYWGREDIPPAVRQKYPFHRSGYRRVKPANMLKARQDWKIEFNRRCVEDPRYNEKGEWIGSKAE